MRPPAWRSEAHTASHSGTAAWAATATTSVSRSARRAAADAGSGGETAAANGGSGGGRGKAEMAAKSFIGAVSGPSRPAQTTGNCAEAGAG